METLTDVGLIGAASVPTIVLLTQAGKMAGMPTRFAPLAAIALGIAFAFIGEAASAQNWYLALVLGLGSGFSASGLYSGVQAVYPGGHTTPDPASPANKVTAQPWPAGVYRQNVTTADAQNTIVVSGTPSPVKKPDAPETP